jgi:hypothetical protein
MRNDLLSIIYENIEHDNSRFIIGDVFFEGKTIVVHLYDENHNREKIFIRELEDKPNILFVRFEDILEKGLNFEMTKEELGRSLKRRSSY